MPKTIAVSKGDVELKSLTKDDLEFLQEVEEALQDVMDWHVEIV